MDTLFGRLFVKNYNDVSDRGVRTAWGTAVAVAGIVANLLLSACKFAAGLLFGAISVTADAVNNLSDAGSQLISLVSVRVAARPADREHPFGHARMEYVASMVVSVIIIIIGFTTLRESAEKLIGRGTSEFSWISVAVLSGSILVKLWLGLLNRRVGRRISSSVMEATAADSLSDVAATGAVLVSQLVLRFTGFDPDAYLGIAVSLLIMWAGFRIMREMSGLLLGEAPDPEFVRELTGFVLSHEGVCGVHDVMVHGYGPGARIVSLHAEVDGSADIFVTHDIIDNIENEIFDRFGAVCTIHMDPIVTDDAEVARVREIAASRVREIDDRLRIHDFRFVRGETHTNLIFDVAAPFELGLTDAELKEKVAAALRAEDPDYRAVVKIDRGINEF
jgi:cation diffusion facilitator family transporter